MNKRSFVLTLAALLVALIATPLSLSAEETFAISVYHGINGRSLGLDKELPVTAEVTKDGQFLAAVDLEFKETFAANLPAGLYEIKVKLKGTDTYIDSMAVGPVQIPAGVDVFLHARLSAKKTPILAVTVE
jgi:hypothetical protein